MVLESFQVFRNNLLECTLELLGPVLGQWFLED